MGGLGLIKDSTDSILIVLAQVFLDPENLSLLYK